MWTPQEHSRATSVHFRAVEPVRSPKHGSGYPSGQIPGPKAGAGTFVLGGALGRARQSSRLPRAELDRPDRRPRAEAVVGPGLGARRGSVPALSAGGGGREHPQQRKDSKPFLAPWDVWQFWSHFVLPQLGKMLLASNR